ncbi:Importin-beta N-terminal domain containing protein [Reticulomyxa filosa]|uniref:Importin-beta N-terminal domain containing protein n=1 Tax=Reticulomyxa filosa TaxID=46433 RepID=X6N9T7_RETFI|nr:Importin-beta N-terminal domain containing protein [Reticulomyxa filosa]|eukprot:ETO22067.1 Importin-beta N-terminal domain containing protein [Reticulomyxa filosa]
MGLLACMGNKSKRVQRSACGGLAELAIQLQKTNNRLSDFVQPIVTTFVKGLELYRTLNFHQLVDVIASVCDLWAVDKERNIVVNPKLMDALIPPLMKRWADMEEASTFIFPIMECLTRFTVHMGPVSHFQQTYLSSMFQQALQLGYRLKNEQAEFVRFFVCFFFFLPYSNI